MKRQRWLVASALVLAALASSAQAQQSKEMLQNIPGNAVGFVYAGRLDHADDKLHAVLKQLKVSLPVPGSPLEIGRAKLGISKGMNAKGSAAVAFFAVEISEPPVPVFVIPVSDYGEFLAQYDVKNAIGISEIALPDGKKLVVAKKGKHAVLCDEDHRETLRKFLNPTTNLAASTEPLHAWLDDNDVSAVMTTRGIQNYVGLARIGLGAAKLLNNNEDTKELLDGWIDSAEKAMKSVESDVTHAGIGTKIDKTGNLHLDMQFLFAKGSGLAKGSTGLKAIEGGALSGLSPGPFAVAFGGAMSEKLLGQVAGLSMESIKAAAKASGDEVPKAKLEKLQKVMSGTYEGVRGMGLVLRGGKEGESLFSGLMTTMHVDDSKAYMERYEKYIPEVNELYKELKIPGFNTMDLKKTKVGKVSVLETTTKMTLGDDELQAKVMEAMLGPGGKLTTSIAPTNSSTVAMVYRPASAMKELLNVKKKSGLQDQPNVAATLVLLPEGSQWILLVDPKGTMDMIKQWAKTFAPDAPIEIPAFPQTAPVGVGAKLSETGLIIHAVIPAQVLEGIGKLVQQGREL